MKKKIRILIVDDSALVRRTLASVISSAPDMEIMATAQDPFVAAEKMRKEIPDIITLDIEMPRMDGLTFLQKIMNQHPIPVIICSTLAEEKSETVFRALELGAVEIIQKPKIGTKQFLEESKTLICDVIRATAMSRNKRNDTKVLPVEPKYTADAVLAKPTGNAMIETTDKVVVVGASTGGTEALRVFLEALPHDAPGTVIVQHMPEVFTAAFAKRLDSLCSVTVKEATNNDSVLRGRALIAQGNNHILLKRSGARYFVELKDGQLVSRHRPSVDVLFRSAARYGGGNAVGVIMTGMGDDGAKGMLEMKEAGAHTIAQDESTSVVFGMPAEAIALGAAERILPLKMIAPEIIRVCGENYSEVRANAL